MRKALLAATALAFTTPSFADEACDRIAKLAAKNEAQMFPRPSYKVIGQGRLYFHLAPDQNCKSKGVFVIPGDDPIAYTEYKGFFSVMYMNRKTGEDFQGWVESKRLKYTGDIGPRY